MRGRKHFNRAAFALAAADLRAKGHIVFVPTEYTECIYGPQVLITNENGDPNEAAENFGLDDRKVFSGDLAFICLDADAIVVLPNSEKSKGTKAETAVAEALGIPVHEWSPALKLD
jgi:hypothetical protein